MSHLSMSLDYGRFDKVVEADDIGFSAGTEREGFDTKHHLPADQHRKKHELRRS